MMEERRCFAAVSIIGARIKMDWVSQVLRIEFHLFSISLKDPRMDHDSWQMISH